MLCEKLMFLQKTAKYRVSRRLMSGHHGGTAGENMPFRKCIGNPARGALMFSVFFGTAMFGPCLILIYLMHKD
ncbi:hypothetical protein D910_08267 [Dendroctonus ponderosae]|uniref:Cytochrome c oxidase polypeptide VIIc n=1 Tax=Dendroctonus ponderosae TaxID=77166 RepID=U4UF28_DENPD|nr:hypothetical protein D910_08267 [Dendroctonus ponderosae]